MITIANMGKGGPKNFKGNILTKKNRDVICEEDFFIP